MSWFVAVLLAWPVVALVVGVLIGTAIRLERGDEPAPRTVPDPVPTATPLEIRACFGPAPLVPAAVRPDSERLNW